MTPPGVDFLSLCPAEDAPAIGEAIRRVVDSGWYVLGPEVEAFETEFAAASGAAHAVGVGSGTDAIALTLRALGIGPGDEVVTTPLSAAYTALAVLQVGARPVFADIDPDRLTLAPEAVTAALTSRTAALLPVHLYGQPADMSALAAIAARHRLALVEDCCQAHLATCCGQPVGTFGAAGAFSFYPTKNLGALGDGGAIVTNDALLAARVRRLRNGGQMERYQHVEPGWNSRLDEIQAAVLRARLPLLPTWTERRRRLSHLYREALRDVPVVIPPELDPGHVYHLFPIRSVRRAQLRIHLEAEGITTLVHYPVPIPHQAALAGAAPAECPTATRVCGELVSLPLHPGLTDADVRLVVTAMRSIPPCAAGEATALRS
jgi:dTDP-3-amino-3,4,6-trideoxy-alpha-D-glucose transaminase